MSIHEKIFIGIYVWIAISLLLFIFIKIYFWKSKKYKGESKFSYKDIAKKVTKDIYKKNVRFRKNNPRLNPLAFGQFFHHSKGFAWLGRREFLWKSDLSKYNLNQLLANRKDYFSISGFFEALAVADRTTAKGYKNSSKFINLLYITIESLSGGALFALFLIPLLLIAPNIHGVSLKIRDIFVPMLYMIVPVIGLTLVSYIFRNYYISRYIEKHRDYIERVLKIDIRKLKIALFIKKILYWPSVFTWTLPIWKTYWFTSESENKTNKSQSFEYVIAVISILVFAGYGYISLNS